MSDEAALTALGMIGAIGFGLYFVFGGSEHEGRVKIDDCLEVVQLKASNIEKYYKDFTCELNTTKKGSIISGKCIHIEMSGSACKSALIYNKEPTIYCKDPKFPYPHYDDLCYPN